MKPFLVGLLFAFSTYVSGASFHERSYRPTYRNLDVIRRQDNQPIVGPLTNEQLILGYQAQCDVSTSTGSQAILNDINNITNTSATMQQTFDSIWDKLKAIDDEGLDPRKFGDLWAPIRQQWTDVLWGSIKTASNTSAYCKDFTDIIMPAVMGTCNTTAAKEAIAAYQDITDDMETNAQATAQAFTDLNTNITTFQHNFADFSGTLASDDQNHIVSLNEAIQTLKGDVNSLNVKITAVAVAMGVTTFVDAAALLLFPEFAIPILGVGVAAVGGEVALYEDLVSARNDDNDNISTDQSMITNLQIQLGEIEAANSTLNSMPNTTATLTTQIGAFDSIWKAVVNDCNQALFFLDNPTSTLPLIIWQTLNNVDCFYGPIANAMDMYASGIQNAQLPPAGNGAALPGGLPGRDEFHQQTMSIISKLDSCS